MQRHVLRGGRDPAFLGVEQLFEAVHALVVEIQKLEGDAHRIAGVQLAQVAHVHLGGEERELAFLDVVGAAAEQLEHFVDGAIEQHIVIGHVEMAVVVDPGRLDPHHRGDEGRKEQRFEVDAVEHVSGLISIMPDYAALVGKSFTIR